MTAVAAIPKLMLKLDPCGTEAVVVAAGEVSVGCGWDVKDGTGVRVSIGFWVGTAVADGSGIDDASALAVSTAQIAPIKSNES